MKSWFIFLNTFDLTVSLFLHRMYEEYANGLFVMKQKSDEPEVAPIQNVPISERPTISTDSKTDKNVVSGVYT